MHQQNVSACEQQGLVELIQKVSTKGESYLVTALRKTGAEVKVYAKHQDLTQASKLRGDVALDLLKRHSRKVGTRGGF